jgi:4-hydroxybenzoate polyprenyltransferase
MSASSERSPRWIRAWIVDRALRSLPLLLALAAMMALVGGTTGALLRTVLALFAVLAFRLWDDVEDIAHDRVHHPERALCHLSSLRAPRLAATLLLALSGASTLLVRGALAPFLAAIGLAAGAHAVARRRSSPGLRPIVAHVVLLKAPLVALALALGSTPGLTAAPRALALYGLVGGYELWHDAGARRSPHARALAVVDVACLSAGLLISALL